MESSNARDRRVREGGGSRSKSRKGKRRQDSNHTRSSTDLPGEKLVAGLGAVVTKHRLILLGLGETQHRYCTVAVVYVARDTVCAAVGILIGALHR